MRSLIIALMFVLAHGSHGQNLKNKLVGEWKYLQKNASEPPDYILLHSSGRYTVFNAADGVYPFPIIEKGNWCFDPEKSIIKLGNREVIQKDAGFVYCHKSCDPIIMHVDSLSEKTMQLSYKIKDKRIVEEY